MGVSQWATFRSEQNFGSPDAFIPERWLTEDGNVVGAGARTGRVHEPQAFMPFSHGPRNCLGKGLAWTELRIILSKLIWHFDIVKKGPEYDWREQLTFVMWEKKPLIVGLTPVQR